MGQGDVYQLLKKHKGKWLNSKQIVEELNIGIGSISTSLKRLRNHKLVFFKVDSKRKNVYWYKVR